jgi:hypothetical protein
MTSVVGATVFRIRGNAVIKQKYDLHSNEKYIIEDYSIYFCKNNSFTPWYISLKHNAKNYEYPSIKIIKNSHLKIFQQLNIETLCWGYIAYQINS